MFPSASPLPTIKDDMHKAKDSTIYKQRGEMEKKTNQNITKPRAKQTTRITVFLYQAFCMPQILFFKKRFE